MNKAEYNEYKNKRVAKPLVWFGIVSIIMLFAGLTSAVIVRKGDGNWTEYQMPVAFLWSSIVIVLSSICLIFAPYFAKKDAISKVKISLILTALLGIVFVFLQLEGFKELILEKVYFTGAQQNASGSFFYVIAGAHLLHLFGGMIAMAIVLFNAFKAKYNSKNLLGLQVFSIYWHFLAGLWIYLYLFYTMII